MESSTPTSGWRWNKKHSLLGAGLAGLSVLIFLPSRTMGLREALAHDGRLAFGAAGGLVVFVALMQLFRQRTARRKAAAALLVCPPQPLPVNVNHP